MPHVLRLTYFGKRAYLSQVRLVRGAHGDQHQPLLALAVEPRREPAQNRVNGAALARSSLRSKWTVGVHSSRWQHAVRKRRGLCASVWLPTASVATRKLTSPAPGGARRNSRTR